VRRILEQTDERLHQHFRQAEPQIKRIIEEGFGRISEVLTEDQKARFDDFRERLERGRPRE
jgi:hypothetical protein